MSRNASRGHSYAAVLCLPHARRTFLAALSGRLCYGTVFLSLTLALTWSTGSLGRTGTVMALFATSTAFLAPARAALLDRFGIRRALPPMALAYAVSLAALGALTWRHAPSNAALVDVVGFAGGAFAPPLGPTMRSLWARMCGDDRELLRRAFSLDTVAEEALYVSGPLVVGVLVLVARPAVGLVLSAVLVAGGTLALVASPVVRDLPAPAPSDRAQGPKSRFSGASRVLEPLLVTAGAGLTLGANSLVLVAFAVGRGQTSMVPWIEASMSVGSIAGGLAYGAASWCLPDRARLPLLAGGLGASVAVGALAPSTYVLCVVAALVGLFVGPTMTCAYLVADELAAPARRTGAGIWVNQAFNAGSSCGYAGIGPAVTGLPTSACFGVAAAPLLLAAGFAAAAGRRARMRVSGREGAAGAVLAVAAAE